VLDRWGSSLKWTLVLLAALVPAWTAGTAAAAEPCATGFVTDYEAPLKALPPLHAPPSNERLPFGPQRLYLGSGSSPLVTGSQPVGFSLAYSSYQGVPSPKLGWTLTARATRVDRKGAVRKLIGEKQLQVEKMNQQQTLSLTFKLPQAPGIYAVRIVFRDAKGRRLGSYGKYYRLLPYRTAVGLTVTSSVVRPGESATACLENPGTVPIVPSVTFLESFDANTNAWTRIPFDPQYAVPVPAILIYLQPGRAMSIGSRVPPNAPPGRYRLFWEGRASRMDGAPFSGGTPLVAFAEFQVVDP
jgi:hypothetical protein